jgi:hypothetical protein
VTELPLGWGTVFLLREMLAPSRPPPGVPQAISERLLGGDDLALARRLLLANDRHRPVCARRRRSSDG